MKPISLKIKGLNSFIDEQVIDFDKLTERGLFGIFGPTGSGKSTILDAITIVLYGKIARDSTDYINTNCDELSISYKFQLGMGNSKNVYISERSVKRDKHGRYKTSYARLVESGDEQVVIAEGPRDVQSSIEKIIGLNIDDFTRSVVLPQGKFSEFLKLKGKDRRNMLERIFALEKYGKNLVDRIRSARNVQLTNRSVLDGEMKRYEGLSYEIYEEAQKELEISIKEEKTLKEEKKSLDETYEKYKEIWELQKELKAYEKRLEELNIIIEDIDVKRDKLEKAKRAAIIKPYIDDLKEKEKELTINNNQLIEIEKELKNIDELLKVIEEQYVKAQKEKDTQIPLLSIKQENLGRALQYSKEKEDEEKKKQELSDSYKKIKQNKDNNDKKLEDINTKIQLYNRKIQENDLRITEIKVEPEYREKVQSAFEKENSYQEIEKSKKEYESKVKKRKENIEEVSKQYNEIIKIREDKKSILSSIEEKRKIMENNSPGDNNLLLQKQENLSKKREIVREAINNRTKKEEILKNLNLILLDEKKTGDEVNLLNEYIKEKEFKLEALNKEIENIESENLAFILASKLKEGDPCPVCGSKEHLTIAHDVDIDSLEEKKALKKEIENKALIKKESLKGIEIKLAGSLKEKENLEKELKVIDEKLKDIEIEQLEEELEKDLSNFENLKENINKWHKEKDDLEKKLVEEKDQYSNINSKEAKLSEILNSEKTRLNELQEEKAIVNQKYKILYEEYSVLKEDLNLESIKDKLSEIKSFEKETIEIEKEQKKLRKLNEELLIEKENVNKIINELNIELNRTVEIGKEKAGVIRRLEDKIKELSEGQGNIEKYLEEIKFTMDKINKDAENLYKSLEEKRSERQKLADKYISKMQNKETLTNIQIEQKEKLASLLKNQDFESIDKVIEGLITEEKRASMDIEIKVFDDKYKTTVDNIKRVTEKLGNESIEEEQWTELQEQRSLKEKLLDEKIREIASKQKTIEDMKMFLDELKLLKKREKEIEHKLSLLNDLDKLVQGNKFVEFAAMNQLKYIAREASKRLKDITNHRYALEIDGEGNFTIRDDKNGGVVRDTSTLSGGETFLTSLALALSLSSQIQLKGSAPLEFFFLDEGFGTLDSGLLEVVMTSLEKLHTDKMSVGIISHVEELKNRVPVKLIVTPSNPGEGGTKVKLEYS